jgi:hypothetical protein
MPEPRDECRPVTLPSGETIRVRGTAEPSPEVAAALGVPLLLMGAWQAAPLLASAGVLAGLAAWSATFPWRGKGRRRNGADGD